MHFEYEDGEGTALDIQAGLGRNQSVNSNAASAPAGQ